MRITPRQQKSIDSVLLGEAHERSAARSQMYSLRRASALNEADVYDSMDSEDLQTAAETELSQDISNTSSDLLTSFDKVLYKKLATLVASAGGEKVSGAVLRDDLEDFDSDGLMEIQQELTADIASVLHKYTSQVALLTSHAKLHGTE